MQRRVEAADRRVSAAVAARLPTITLSFTPEYQYSAATLIDSSLETPIASGFLDPVEGFVWSVGASLNVPLFDGFAGRAGVRAQEAQVEMLIAQYTQAVLGALVEVDSALVLERQQTIQLTHLRRRLEIAQATLDAAQQRYRAGLSDFLPVLGAIATPARPRARGRHRRAAARLDRIQLHRALGGTWPAQRNSDQ